MTIVKGIAEYLKSYGLGPEEVAAVLKAMQDSKHMKTMIHQWEEPEEDSPRPLLAILRLRAQREAIELLEASNPMHCALRNLKLNAGGEPLSP